MIQGGAAQPAARGRALLIALAAVGGLAFQAAPALAYEPITLSLASRTVTLTGKDLTIDQLVDVARVRASGLSWTLAPRRATSTSWSMVRSLPVRVTVRLARLGVMGS